MLTYANNSLTYWQNKNNHLALESFFMTGNVIVLLKMHKKYTRFYGSLLFTPVSIEKFSVCEKCG